MKEEIWASSLYSSKIKLLCAVIDLWMLRPLAHPIHIPFIYIISQSSRYWHEGARIQKNVMTVSMGHRNEQPQGDEWH